MKNKGIKIISLLLIGVLALGLTACGTSTGEKEVSQLEKIKSSGKIVLGTSADYPPYEYHKEIDGKDTIVGFDIEIAKEIAKDLGVELIIKDMKFDGLLAALDTGNIDFVVAGMTPTEDREKSVDFSKIYYTGLQSLIIRGEDATKFTSLEELNGKKIGAQKGSIQEEIATEQIPNGNVKALGKISDLIMELKNNKVDALVVSHSVAKAYESKNSDILVSDISFETDGEGSAVAVKEGSKELVDAINKTLDRLVDNNLIDKFVTEATEDIE